MATSFVAPQNFGLRVGAEPVRRIKPRTDRPSMPGWFPTRKGTLPNLRTESLLELDGLEQLEINPDCVLMAAQPHHLVYDEEQPNGGTIRVIYTPDVAVLMRDGSIAVVDFKVAKSAESEAWRRREKLLKYLYERDHGVVFSTITDEDIRLEPRHQNAKILMLHRPAIDDVEAETTVMAAVDEHRTPCTIEFLCQRCALPTSRPDIDRAYSAILSLALKGFVELDLSEVISATTFVTARGAA